MKRTITSLASLFIFAATCFANIPNEKVLKTFQATFLSPTEVKWYDHTDYYEVSFVQVGIRSNVKYDLDGNFVCSTRFYKEQQLPTNILCKLKKKYADENIYGVTEITTNDEVTYYVKLQDDKNWITIKVSANGQMSLYEKFRKA